MTLDLSTSQKIQDRPILIKWFRFKHLSFLLRKIKKWLSLSHGILIERFQTYRLVKKFMTVQAWLNDSDLKVEIFYLEKSETTLKIQAVES